MIAVPGLSIGPGLVATGGSVVAATIANTANAFNGGNSTTYTFTTQSFGAATSNDFIAVCTGALDIGASALSSATIDGQAATLINEASDGPNPASGIFIAAALGNSSGTVSVTWADAGSACGISVYLITGISGTAAHDSVISTGVDPAALTMNVPAGGVAIGCAAMTASASYTWTNLTEDNEQDLEASNGHMFGSASDAFASLQSALAITCDASGSPSFMTGCGASWGP